MNKYGQDIILRSGWNFHNDIAIPLEGEARKVYCESDRPIGKIYDADGIESGGYFAEVMILILRKVTEYSNNMAEINQFIEDIAPFIQKKGNEIPHEVAQGIYNKFKELMKP
ncbi:MAG: hypothetical protein J6I76_18315 [Oribacterium sp.]|nr:hypothetical protein [Oribacterium sp.]